MTEKQEKILGAALSLFAKDGFSSTSTSKVAREAGVSEGLIFRHFENKEGLLNAILQNGREKLTDIFNTLHQLEDPKEILRRVITLPLTIEEDQRPFWKLLYALKWQADVYDNSMSNPMKDILVPVFEALNYRQPELEAELIMVLMDGMASHILLKRSGNVGGIKELIFKKYDL
ncbi:MAG: TetR/AcrR family transcriptional regulator [Bacteroidota bacterium]